MKFENVKFGENLYIKGRIGWKGLKKNEYLNLSDYRIINGESLTNDGIDWSKAGFITKERYDESPEIMLEMNDILISKDGTIGKIGFVNNLEKKTTVASGIFVVRNIYKDKINIRYVYHFLRSQKFQNFIKMRTEGSVIPHLYQKDFVELDFPLPNLLTQNKIVKLLDSIEERIFINNKINDNLAEQIQAIYHNYFDKFINDEKISLSKIIDVRDGTHDSPKSQDTGYFLITSKHLLPFGVDKSTANLISEKDYNKINERSSVKTSDILISMIGTVGLISLVIENPVNFAIKNIGLFKTSEKPELTYYIHNYLLSDSTKQTIEQTLAGSTQKYISLGELRKLPIYLPSDDLLKSFNVLITPYYERLILNSHENNALTQIRDVLLPKLMSGEIDVSNINIKTDMQLV